ncbi:MAG: hypothetical protein SGI77_08445 [Pirellulaceae bacterium]|nr:hypothetical protein [Pirellulaceae bacterium]
MRSNLAYAVALSMASLLGPNLNAAIVWNESTTQLSRNNVSPTNLGTLLEGTSSILANVQNSAGNVDYFRFTIPVNFRLDTMIVSSYSGGDGLAFLSMDDAATFPFTRQQMNNNNPFPDETQFIGGTTFGPGNGSVGIDILTSSTTNGIGGRFIGQQPLAGQTTAARYDWLGPGTYSVYVQQTGPLTQYTLDLGVIAAVPEPSAAMLSIVSVACLAMRRKSRFRNS